MSDLTGNVDVDFLWYCVDFMVVVWKQKLRSGMYQVMNMSWTSASLETRSFVSERLLLLLLVILLLLLFVLLLGFFLGSSLLLTLSQESVIQLTRMSEEAFLAIMRNLRCLRISGLLARSDSEPLGQLLGGAL